MKARAAFLVGSRTLHRRGCNGERYIERTRLHESQGCMRERGQQSMAVTCMEQRPHDIEGCFQGKHGDERQYCPYSSVLYRESW